MKKLIGTAAAMMLAATAFAQSGITIPAGTPLTMKLENTLTSFSSRPGDPFQGRITTPVIIDGKTAIPAGATVQGRVTKVSDERRLYGRPTIAIFPEAVILPNGERLVLNANLVDTSIGKGISVNDEGQVKGQGYTNRDLWEIGGGTGAGMLIGGLAGGGKGVLIGGAIGAGATVGHWLSKKNSAALPTGTELMMELSRPMTLDHEPATPGQ
jgi:hypothetical protein